MAGDGADCRFQSEVRRIAESIYRTISEQVSDRIRAEINSEELKEDALLREQDLSDRFGASRGTVRHALMTLSVEGLVVSTPNIGMRVASHPTPECYRRCLMGCGRFAAYTTSVMMAGENITFQWTRIGFGINSSGETRCLRNPAGVLADTWQD